MKRKYEDYRDEELIVFYRGGDQEAADYLMNKYKNLVRSCAKSMYILGADTEDLIQEGMIGLFKAIRDYDLNHEVLFSTFAKVCVSRQIYTAVEASGRKKHMPLNTYVSFYSETEPEKDGTKLELSGVLESEEKSPEENVIDKENVEFIEQIIQLQLSKKERQTLELHMTGMTTSEIAKILGEEEKSADNALQRAKNKIRKAMKEK